MNTDSELIFNYFEGNLSSTEEAQLVDRVAADKVLEQEFEYWRKSYVDPVKLTYANKAALLKPWYHSLSFRIGAGSAFLATIIICLFMFHDEGTSIHEAVLPSSAAEITVEPITSDTPAIIAELTPREEETTPSNTVSERTETITPISPVLVITEPMPISELKAITTDSVATVEPMVVIANVNTVDVKKDILKVDDTKRKKRIKYKVPLRERMRYFSSNLKKLKWTKEETVPIEGF